MNNTFTPSRILFFSSIALVLGILFETFLKIPALIVWGFLLFSILIIVTSFFKKNVRVFGFCLLFFVIGISRLQVSSIVMSNDALRQLNDTSEKITLTGYIFSEPEIRQSQQKLRVRIDKSIVLVTTGIYPKYNYLDKIELSGKLKSPPVFEDFNYQNYLAKDGIYSIMDYPTIVFISSRYNMNIFSWMHLKLLSFKGIMVNSLKKYFSPPNEPILEGIIFGNDKNMSAELKNKFVITGLSHVTAVSGTNIVILINILMIVLLAFGFWRGQAFWWAVALIWIYIVMIGFPVSGIRAAIMGVIALLAQKIGRQNSSFRILVIVASIMLLQSPMLLVYDVSFQLSFLASLGIMHVKPLLDYAFSFFQFQKIRWLWSILSVTLAAQITTLPIIVYNFGTVSLVAPITNLLILPVVEFLTVIGFVTAFLGMFSYIVGYIFSLPCLGILWYFNLVLDFFSKPWASKTIEHFSWIWMAVYYVLLIALIYFAIFYQKKDMPFK